MADTVGMNKSYFDNDASHYDAKHEKSLAQLTAAIQSRLAFIGVKWADDDGEDDDEDDEDDDEDSDASGARPVRLLDYACGTGMISRALAPYTTQCVGVDISGQMVAMYNARVQNQGLTEDDMFAVVGDLSNPYIPYPQALSAPEFFDFDVAAVGGGFHHFADPELVARRLVERLRPGGVLFIWDFFPHEAAAAGHHHGAAAADTVAHHGFSEDRVRDIFVSAGAGRDFALEELGSGLIMGSGHEHDEHGHEDDMEVDQEHEHEREKEPHAREDEGDEGRKRRVFLARGTKIEMRTPYFGSMW